MEPLEKKPTPGPEDNYAATHKGQLSPIRTFNSDMAQAIRDKGGSVVRIAIAENERHQQEAADRSIKSKKNIAFTVTSAILIIGAVGLAVWAYQHRKNSAIVAPIITTLPSSLIPSDEADTISASGLQVPELVAAIQTSVADPKLEQGIVRNIVVIDGPATRIPAPRFLSIIGAHAPVGFTQALLPDFMLGAYKYEEGNLFMIVHGTARDFLLAGMLEWEPYLFNDMTALFGIDTSGFTKAELQSLPFTDTIIANRDARAVLDKEGDPLFFYSFLDPNTILFSTDPRTLAEVIRRR